MSIQTRATVVGGLLKPDEGIGLPDQTRVNITIETLPEAATSAAAWQSLKAWTR